MHKAEKGEPGRAPLIIFHSCHYYDRLPVLYYFFAASEYFVVTRSA